MLFFFLSETRWPRVWKWRKRWERGKAMGRCSANSLPKSLIDKIKFGLTTLSCVVGTVEFFFCFLLGVLSLLRVLRLKKSFWFGLVFARKERVIGFRWDQSTWKLGRNGGVFISVVSCVRVEFTVVLHRKDQDGVRCTPRVYTLKIWFISRWFWTFLDVCFFNFQI